MTPQALVAFVNARRFPLGTEKAVQADLSSELTKAGIAHRREFRLSGKDIVDFMFPETGLVAELKIQKSPGAIYDQCRRYCEHDAVTGLVLVTNAAMGLPATIAGKPAYVASLGRGWL